MKNFLTLLLTSFLTLAIVYFFPWYTVKGATVTKHLTTPNGMLLAEVEKVGTTTTTRYIHPDYLGSVSAITNEAGQLAQVIDYYPYGSERITQGTSPTDRGYIGEREDDETALSYLNARYYNPHSTKFLSQDPVYWEVGQSGEGRAVLLNPQAQNSYSYAGNNPITNKDPGGRFWWVGFYNWTGYEGIRGVAMKAGEVFGGHSRAMNAIHQNQSIVNAVSSKYGVNPTLTNAIMYEEQSHLTPDEVLGREQAFPDMGKGGVGIMQVSGAVGKGFGGYSKAELARNPNKNIDAGTAYLGSIGNRLNTANPATIGTAYNGASAYGQRIQTQVNNPNYNMNVIVYGLQRVVGSLSSLVKSFK